MTLRAALLVDGDNVSARYAKEISDISGKLGRIDIARVYLNAAANSSWLDARQYRAIHTGTGKNATDIMMAIDAIEFGIKSNIDVMIIASSDGDFVHLHQRLREYGLTTVGIGEAKAPESVRVNANRFFELSPQKCKVLPAETAPNQTELDEKIRRIIAADSKNGAGIPISHLAPRMHRKYGVKISSYPEKTWRGYLSARPELYELDPKGPEAKVRFKREGFGV